MALYIQEFGPSSAATVLFLHGGGGAGWMWQAQVAALPDFHCLVPDLAEQGQSVAEKPFSIQGSAVQMAELIRSRAHGGKAHVVGLSEGAQITVALLKHAPELVQSAIVSSALVRPLPGASLMTPGLMALTYRWSVAPLKNSDWWIRLNMKYAAAVPEPYYPQFRQTFQGLTESGFVNLMVENQRFRLPQGLAQVAVPTLVVVGENEVGVMVESARDLAAALPNAQAYTVHHTPKLPRAAAHNWNLNAPDLFNQMIRAWLTHAPLPSALQTLPTR